MSFARTYEQAKKAYKPMRRTPMRSRTSLKQGTKQMKRSRMKRHRISPEETAWRNEVLRRADFRCQWVDQQTGERCEVRGAENLDAHHKNERSQRPDLVDDPLNGAALCGGPGRHHDGLHHTVEGRRDGTAQGLLNPDGTYEAAQKRKREVT